MGRVVTNSADETIAAGKELGSSLKDGQIVCLFGDLGAGKTTFIKGLVAGAQGIDPDEVSSPTFVYLHPYGRVNHFDLYRLPSSEAFCSLGFDEYFHSGICVIEWAERINDILPKGHIAVTLRSIGLDKREICIEER